jgi:lipoprotein signal peptidase
MQCPDDSAKERMTVRVLLTLWIYFGGLVWLLVSAAAIQQAIEIFPTLQVSSYGNHVPAFSQAVTVQAHHYPAILYAMAIVSLLIGIYAWRSSHARDVKTFAITLLSAINLFIAGSLPTAFLMGYFVLPKYVNSL